MITSLVGLNLIKRWEGCKLAAYSCPAGIPTIGYGSTESVKLGMQITKLEAEDRLRRDVGTAEKAIARLVKTKLSQGQFDALVSFIYNVGVGNFGKSTLLRLLNSGDISGAAAQFPRWNKAAGRELPGLVARRRDEQVLFAAKESA